MPREQSFYIDLLNRFDYVRQVVKTAPLILGGSSGSGGGGGGTPPGGFVGKLPQTQVAGDTDELRTLTVISSGSGSSLLDNLNNIRYWEKVQFGTSAPATTFAGQFWVDTSSGSVLNYRNATDTAWLSATSGSVTPNSQAVFSVEGVVSTGSGSLRIYNTMGRTVTISKVFLAVDTPPSGSSLICDVNMDTASIFSAPGDRPTITAGNNTGFTTTIGTASWADGAYLTLDRDAVGSSEPGRDLTAHIVYS